MECSLPRILQQGELLVSGFALGAHRIIYKLQAMVFLSSWHQQHMVLGILCALLLLCLPLMGLQDTCGASEEQGTPWSTMSIWYHHHH